MKAKEATGDAEEDEEASKAGPQKASKAGKGKGTGRGGRGKGKSRGRATPTVIIDEDDSRKRTTDASGVSQPAAKKSKQDLSYIKNTYTRTHAHKKQICDFVVSYDYMVVSGCLYHTLLSNMPTPAMIHNLTGSVGRAR